LNRKVRCNMANRLLVVDEEDAPLPDHPFAGYENLLGRFAYDAANSGLIGEKPIAQLVFLVAISARLPEPLHVVITGPRGAGKSYLMHTVAKFIPAQHKRVLDNVSVRGLRRSSGAGFRHRALFIDDCADFPACSFPAAFVQNTSCRRTQPEDRPGRLWLAIDESPERAQAIRMSQARKAAGGVRPPNKLIYRRWHTYLRLLKDREVVIPCFDGIAAPQGVSLQTLLGLVRASAFLHQYRRLRHLPGRILAAWDDYQMVQSLLQAVFRDPQPQTPQDDRDQPSREGWAARWINRFFGR
jgi:energy-coupling factor transporter ATP-binding protein EcfA2